MNRPKPRQLLGVLLIAALAAAATGWYFYSKPVAATSSLATDFVTNITALLEQANDDPTATQHKYSGKVIEMTGTISQLTPAEGGRTAVEFSGPLGTVFVVLNPDQPSPQLQVGREYRIKAKFVGTDQSESSEESMLGDTPLTIEFKEGVILF